MSNFFELIKTIGSAFGTQVKPMGGRDGSNLVVPIRCLTEGEVYVVNQDYLMAIAEEKILGHSLITVGAYYISPAPYHLFSKEGYVEQSSGLPRSIVSTDADDAAAGSGARVVCVRGIRGDGVWFCECVSLMGITPVNFAETNIQHINGMEVVDSGSADFVSAGTISIMSDVGGGGIQICALSAGDDKMQNAQMFAGEKMLFITVVSASAAKKGIIYVATTETFDGFSPFHITEAVHVKEGLTAKIEVSRTIAPGGKIAVYLLGDHAGSEFWSVNIRGWSE